MNEFAGFGTLLLIGGVALYLWACFIAGSLADAKGLDRVEYFVIALLMSPVIGLLAVIASTPEKYVLEKRAIARGDAKRCRACREIANAKATVCPHCGGADFEVPVPRRSQPAKADETLPRPRRRPSEGYRFCPNANCGAETPIAAPNCQVCKRQMPPEAV